MKQLNLNKKFLFSLIVFIFFTPLLSEDSIDIWKKENLKNNTSKVADKNPEQTESKIKIISETKK